MCGDIIAAMVLARVVLLVVVATAMLTSVAAADHDAAKQRVAINMAVVPEEKFVLTPLRAGALKRDAGKLTGNWQDAPGFRLFMRNGQEITSYDALWMLWGKRGVIKIREHSEWVGTGSDANRDGSNDAVATGTWKVVVGTGAYAGMTGGGGSGHAGLGHRWNARFEGLVAVP